MIIVGDEMKIRLVCILLLVVSMLLGGCKKEVTTLEEEPTASYDWMAGESPVVAERVGVSRAGVHLVSHAVSPSGIYFIPEVTTDGGDYVSVSDDSFIIYADHGSDRFVKLCGRVDCTHDDQDCNAYLYKGSDLSYYQGYLYAVSGEGSYTEGCGLIRMAPDGSEHIVVLDMLSFAQENGGSFAMCDMINEGYCVFTIYTWKENEEQPDSVMSVPMESYYYKVDGSMEGPKSLEDLGSPYYQCGEVFMARSKEVVDGIERDACWDLDLEMGTRSYLTEYPGNPAWFGEREAYYFKEGAICRYDYSSEEEERMVDTGLEGNYFAFFFPDCIVVASRDRSLSDENLYFYNWAFEFVDKVELDYPHSNAPRFHVVAETAYWLILSDEHPSGRPTHYIDKSELGTGDAVPHALELPELVE